MEIFGNYQVEGEISVSAHMRLYRARRTVKPTGDVVCLKVWAIHEGGAFSKDMGRLFLESAKVQAELGRKCPRTWVPILDEGSDPRGHFVVTPLYPDTLALRIGTLSADSVLLKFVLSRVLAALEDVEKHASRDHGNLKPSKIFIEGSGPVTNRKIRLNELAPEELIDRSVYRKPDLRALGELIFMLASRTPSVNANMRSVPAHTEWPRLGSEEQTWKNLCSDLLDPNGRFQKADLAELRRELNKLGKVKSNGNRWILAVAALLIVGAGAGGYLWYSNRPPKIDVSITEQYVDYCVAYEDWLKEFARLSRRRRADIAGDPYLSKTLVGVLEKRGEKLVPGEAFRMLLPSAPTEIPEELALDSGLQRRVTDAYIFLLDFLKTLDGWPVRQRALEQAGRFRQLGWEGAAQEVEALAKDYVFDLNLFDQLISIREMVPQAQGVLTAWDKLAAQHATIAALNDPMLAQLPAWQVSRLTEAGQSMQTLLQSMDELGREIRPLMDILETPNWRRQYAYDLFRGELQARGTTLTGMADIQEWIRLIGEFRIILDPRTAQVPPLNDMIRQIDSQVARLPGFNLINDHEAFSGELAALRVELTRAGEIPAIERELPRINETIRSLQTGLADLNKRVSELISRNMIDPVEWLEKWRNEPIPVSGVIADTWYSRRDAIIKPESVASLKAQEGRAYRLERMLNHLRDLLTGIDQALPAPLLSGTDRSREMDQHLEPFLVATRANSAEEILAQLPPTEDAEALELNVFLERTPVSAVFARYQDILDSASAFSAQFARLQRELLATDPPGEGFYAFIEAEILDAQGWIARLGLSPAKLAVLDSLIEIGQIRSSNSAADLVRLLGTSSKAPAIRWTAWRRLETMEAFPSNSAGWQQWVTAFQAFQEMLPATVRPALNGPAFWSMATRKASDLATLKTALSSRPVFGGVLDALPDQQRFVQFLLEQRERVQADRSIFSASGAQVVDLQQSILDRLNEQFPGTDTDIIPAFREAVANVDPNAPGDEVDPALLGPGTLSGWKTVTGGPDGKVVYRWAGFDLPFLPVDVGAGDLYYLSTIELPAGMVILWLQDNPEAWQAVHDSSTTQMNGTTERHGPNTWTPDDEGRPDYVMQWQSVSPRWELLQYAAPLEESRPLDEHPIQFVSPSFAQAIAKSFNCQLPPPAIYQALMGQAATQDIEWNRRDQTWLNQRDHIAQTNSRILTSDPPWPDQNVFVPEGLSVAVAENAASAVDYNDGQLWFQEVYSSPDSPAFLNLIGNVAEYAYDEATSTYYVVGASALSPPEVSPGVLYEVDPDQAGSGFSDVGLRLSFAIPRNTPGAQLARTILNPRFLEDLFPSQ